MTSVHLVELASLGVLAVFTTLEVRAGRHRESLLLGLVLILAAWLGEDTCIRGYAFYQYSPDWHFILDKMPPMVALIWPFVILSDLRVMQAVAEQLGRGASRLRPLWLGMLVTLDACLMEAVSVQAGLWSWNEPGLFGVPVIGVLGWGYFAACALWLWERLPGRTRLLTVVLAPLLTHGLLLVSWWGGLRWALRGPLPNGLVVGLFALGSAGLSLWLLRRPKGQRIQIGREVMGIRILAASVFFLLLVLYGRQVPMLWAFVASFVPPYLLATDLRSLMAFRNRAFAA